MNRYPINVVSLLYDYEDYEAADDLVAGYIIAVLRKEGYVVELKEISRERATTDLEMLMGNMPEVVIFTIPRTSNIPELSAFCHYIKKVKSDCKIILTGWSHHSAPLDVDLIMNECQSVDIIIQGEGEQTVTELVGLLKVNSSLDGCKGIIYREDTKIIRNAERELLMNLDDLPFPARDSQKLHNYDSMWLYSARGCLGNCTFCAIPATRSKKNPIWRGRSPENVVAELKHLNKTYHIKQFNFLDPTFEDPGKEGKGRIEKIAKLILAAGLDITYLVHMRAENWSEMDYELMNLLYLSGLESILVGIEAGSSNSLNLFNKRAKLENYYTFINLTNQFNFNIDCGFIMFHPYSTFKDLVANAEFLKSIGLADTLCTFSSKLYLFPRTQIYKKLEVDNLLENTENNYYTLYDYKFIDEKVKILSDNMLKVNNILATKNFFHFKGITKLITYISRMRRKILKLGREYEVLLGDLLLLEQALNKMRTNINELNYHWFLECINWVQNNGTEAEFLQMLDFLLDKIEDEIYQVQKVQIKQGLKLQRILKM